MREFDLMSTHSVDDVEARTESSEIWDLLKTMVSNAREQRLAYLLFNCGLKPREIVRFCPREFSDIDEIYHLRCNLMARLLRNAILCNGS
jgi:hypothetical protein